jgi:hypothetical protein
MKRAICLIVVLALAGAPDLLAAEDSVTIPKSRLEELERKAAELEKLKKEESAPAAENAGAPAKDPAPVSAPPQPAPPAEDYPEVASLPPIESGEMVDTGMLSAHFKQDPKGASKRYAHQRIRVSGVISGFDRPVIARNYKVILRAAGSESPVVCDFYPPETYKAVFSANDGTSLMAVRTRDEARVTLARVGQSVVIEGECRGAKRKAVQMSGCRFVESGK